MRTENLVLAVTLMAAMLATRPAHTQDLDGGATHDTSTNITQIAIDPVNSSLAYAIDAELGILQSFDGGMTWTPAGAVGNISNKNLYRVAVANDGSVAVGTTEGSVYASYDGGMTWGLAPGSEYAGITVDIAYLGGDSMPAGQPGRFRVTINNAGPDSSTNTRVWFAWFRSPAFGQNVGYDYTMSPSQGSCSRSITPEPDCYVGTIAANGSMQIGFNGNTEPNKLGWYTLRVWVESDQAAKTMLGEFSLGSSVTIAESGGGAAGIWFVALLAVALFRRRRTRWATHLSNESVRLPDLL